MDRNEKLDIVPANLAIKAMMDNGYKNAAYALAELMDNSIQAKAKHVELLCIENSTLVSQRTKARINQIAVLDDGHGMDINTLRIALQFGNGTRLDIDQQKGMGKFGFGLPNASISQAKKVEVWSWTNSVKNALYTYLDVDDIISGRLTSIPEPESQPIPDKWMSASKNIGNSGTLVVWSRLERCMWKTGDAVINNSQFLIGRMYRKFLENNKVSIRMAVLDGDKKDFSVNSEIYVKPNDPLYLMTNTSTPAPFDKESLFEYFPTKENYVTTVPIRYKNETHVVHIRTSIAKLQAREGDSPGRGTPGTHAAKNIGVSILRAQRELDLDSSWAQFGNPRERWWGLEIEFPPALDEVFGVTNNKQHATNFSEFAKVEISDLIDEDQTYQKYKDDMFEDEDPRLPLIELARTVKKLIKEMRQLIETQRVGSRSVKRTRDVGPGPEKEATDKTRELQGEGHQGVSDEGENKPGPERQAEIKQAIIDSGISPEDAEDLSDQVVKNSLKYVFLHAVLDTPAFFSVQPKGGSLVITLNTNHPAHSRLVDILEKDLENGNEEKVYNESALYGLKLLLCAWARYEDEAPNPQMRQRIQEARIDWGRMARRFLDTED